MATVSITSDQFDKKNLNALKTFLQTLKIKYEMTNDLDISEEHKKIVLDRVKKSKTKKLVDWDDVKNNFDGI